MSFIDYHLQKGGKSFSEVHAQSSNDSSPSLERPPLFRGHFLPLNRVKDRPS